MVTQMLRQGRVFCRVVGCPMQQPRLAGLLLAGLSLKASTGHPPCSLDTPSLFPFTCCPLCAYALSTLSMLRSMKHMLMWRAGAAASRAFVREGLLEWEALDQLPSEYLALLGEVVQVRGLRL